MGNLSKHAQTELEMAGLFSDKGDFYGGMTGKAVMELIDVFEKQGHSGMSAPMVVSIFKDLANFKPINPIKCTDEEWGEVSEGTFQNKRLSAVFKEGKDGKPYYLDAIVWQYEDGGAFTGTVEGISSRQFIKLPFLPKTFYVKVTQGEENKIIDREELEKAFNYYERG
jgi:hypothetical protein